MAPRRKKKDADQPPSDDAHFNQLLKTMKNVQAFHDAAEANEDEDNKTFEKALKTSTQAFHAAVQSLVHRPGPDRADAFHVTDEQRRIIRQLREEAAEEIKRREDNPEETVGKKLPSMDDFLRAFGVEVNGDEGEEFWIPDLRTRALEDGESPTAEPFSLPEECEVPEIPGLSDLSILK